MSKAKKTDGKLQNGQAVVFLCDVAYKSAAGRTSYAARVGVTGKVRAANPDGTYIIDVDRKLSIRRNVVDEAKPEWIAPVQPNILIEEAARSAKDSIWKGYTYEQLKAVANKNKLTWRETDNPRINLMWVIDALKKADIQPPFNVDGNAANVG